MQTVFSHIVQKRLSQENENVATDALSFILETSEAARDGMMKLLRGVVADMPALRFETQETEGSMRPDIWGRDATGPRVFVENKFWAGLTDNQPVSYLRQLAKYAQPTVLLVVAPDAREQSLWRELMGRLELAEVGARERGSGAGNIVHAVTTGLGPILALTSWTRLLAVLDLEVLDDPSGRGNLRQLQALCEAADADAFVPISASQVSDLRIPAFLLQLSSIARAAVELAVTEGVLTIANLRVVTSWDSLGRYAQFPAGDGFGVWIGMHFGLWRRHGGSPLWLVFSGSDWGRSKEARPLLEPWAARHGVFTTFENRKLAIPVSIALGEDKDHAVRGVVCFLREVAGVLAGQPLTDQP